MDALWRSVHPKEFCNRFLSKGVRPDGRGLLKPRRSDSHVGSISSINGSARVQIGRTVVLAGIQCEPTPPAETEPTRGRVIVSLDLAALCSPAVGGVVARGGVGGAGRLEREYAPLLELLQRIATGGLIEMDSLCAVEGRAVWTCFCDLYVLEVNAFFPRTSCSAMLSACYARPSE